MKTIKLQDGTYQWLVQLAGNFQRQLGEPVSMDKALQILKDGMVGIEELGGHAVLEKKTITKKISEGFKKWTFRQT